MKSLRDIVTVMPKAVSALMGALADADWHVRKEAAEALGKIGPAAVEAVPALTAALADADEYIRWKIAETLKKNRDAGRSQPLLGAPAGMGADDRKSLRAACEISAPL